MLLPEKYESIFDVLSKGPSSGSLVNKALFTKLPNEGPLLETSKILSYFSGRSKPNLLRRYGLTKFHNPTKLHDPKRLHGPTNLHDPTKLHDSTKLHSLTKLHDQTKFYGLTKALLFHSLGERMFFMRTF